MRSRRFRVNGTTTGISLLIHRKHELWHQGLGDILSCKKRGDGKFKGMVSLVYKGDQARISPRMGSIVFFLLD